MTKEQEKQLRHVQQALGDYIHRVEVYQDGRRSPFVVLAKEIEDGKS